MPLSKGITSRLCLHPARHPIRSTVYLRESARLSPPSYHPAAHQDRAPTSRSLTAEREHKVSLGKQKAVSTASAYRKSDDVAVVFTQARAFHQFGQLAEAQVGYKKVLKKRPNHFDALH